jgi:hypothetical protein
MFQLYNKRHKLLQFRSRWYMIVSYVTNARIFHGMLQLCNKLRKLLEIFSYL